MRVGLWLATRPPRLVMVEPHQFVNVTFICFRAAGADEPWGALVVLTGEFDDWSAEEGVEWMSKRIREMIREKKADTNMTFVASDEWLLKLAPTLHELLTTKIKEEGKVWEPFTLFMYAKQGNWLLSCNGKQYDRNYRGEGATIEEAIADLESRIKKGEGTPAQRPSTASRSRNGQEIP